MSSRRQSSGSGSPTRFGGSPSRSANRRAVTPGISSRAESSEQVSETEASLMSEGGIPPKSIKHMRDNLRHMIDTMGDQDNCGGYDDTSDSVAFCESPATTECNEVRSRTSCRCCGKQTCSSDSGGECCTCDVVAPVLPEVHKTCVGKSRTSCRCCGKQTSSSDSGGECCTCDVGKNACEATIVARTRRDRYPCVDDCTSGERRYRAYAKCRADGRYPKRAASSEECPCDDPCPGKRNARKIRNFLNKVVGFKENIQTQHELYKFRLKQQDPNFKPPRQLIFDLVDGIPREPPPLQKETKPKRPFVLRSDPDDYDNKVDVYYFDHGNSGYYRTTDRPPPLMADFFIEQTDLYATRFWAEIFGTIHIGVAFVTTFLLQLFRFVFYSVMRPLTVGLIQLASDYFVKPLLSILFNGVVQPLLILFYNVATSFRDLCEPVAQGVGFFLREIAGVFRSVRLVEVNKMKSGNSCPGRDV